MAKIRAVQRKNVIVRQSSGDGNVDKPYDGSYRPLAESTAITNSAVSKRGTGVYRPLVGFGNTDDYLDSQFQKPPIQVPVKSICLAGFLCSVGAILFIIGFLVCIGQIESHFSDRVWPMMIMGMIMFIPGAYYVRIAYYAFKGKVGFSFEDIPEFD